MKLSVKKNTKLKKLAKKKPIIKRIRIKFDREKIEGEITKNFIL
jgi:hypothetical protein